MVRVRTVVWTLLALLMLGLGVGHASDRDETIVTVQVSSSDHEFLEGYFSLGDSTTLIAKPGSDLHRFLARQRGRNIRIVLSSAETRELSRLGR